MGRTIAGMASRAVVFTLTNHDPEFRGGTRVAASYAVLRPLLVSGPARLGGRRRPSGPSIPRITCWLYRN